MTALQLEFGSALHSVYNRPVRSDRMVVAPFLFGSELNTTIYHELRQEIQELMREYQQRPQWSFETSTKAHAMLPLPQKNLTAKSKAVDSVVNKICEYFSIDATSTGVGGAFRRGTPLCRYRRLEKYVRAEVKKNVPRVPLENRVGASHTPRPDIYPSRQLCVPAGEAGTSRSWPCLGAPAFSR
jgi:hypothetical protein